MDRADRYNPDWKLLYCQVVSQVIAKHYQIHREGDRDEGLILVEEDFKELAKMVDHAMKQIR